MVKDGQIARVGYLPCIAGDNSAPETVGNDEKGRQVFEYMENITKGAELNAKFEWDGDEVILYT
jgi:poly-gamma-glutamate synthesis protein (capsule biosynthesis protein)